MAFSLIILSISTFSLLDGRRVLGGRFVVERGAELLGGEVGELVDALLPAGAAQVVAALLLALEKLLMPLNGRSCAASAPHHGT